MTPAGHVGGRAPRGTWPARPAHASPAPVDRARTPPAVRTGRPISTQEAFGRILVDLSRDEAVAPYLVTTAPDVATSTNLAGFINRTGVFAPDAAPVVERGRRAAAGPRARTASTSSWASAR